MNVKNNVMRVLFFFFFTELIDKIIDGFSDFPFNYFTNFHVLLISLRFGLQLWATFTVIFY